MSLLLDALKRAEQEKLAKNGDAPVTPSARHDASAANLELQPLQAVPSSPPPRSAAAAAQQVFNAKAAATQAGSNRGAIWAIVGAVATVVIAAGAYVFWSVKKYENAPAVTAANRARAPAPQISASTTPSESFSPSRLDPLPATIATPSQASSAQSGSSPPPAPAPFTPVLPSQVPPAAASPQLPAAQPQSPPLPPAATRPTETPVSALLREAPAERRAAPFALERTAERPRVPASLGAGYAALRDGDLPAARRGYDAALAADPMSVDAILGLATVEARSGNRTLAAGQYRHALDLDPRNATALAGLAAVADFVRPEALESQLRSDLARAPQSGTLHFALGSLYAAQSRWNEAQAEFFEAHRVDPANPDILYNLAVSLDSLGQSRLAADYYRRALEAASGRAAQFDPAAIGRRLAEIRP